MQFSFAEMWQQMGFLAKAVVVLLGLMSIGSLGIIVERLLLFARARRQSTQYVLRLRELLGGKKVKEAREAASEAPASPVARIVSAGIAEYLSSNSADLVYRALERHKEREIADLRRGLSNLATVGSTAPFVGLFGTVVGIINAFQSMAATGSGGLGAVSAGIAEALVATAFGLLVAIPAVWMFNYLSSRVEGFVVDMNDVASEVVDFIAREKV